jgi:hypothetical protein
LHKSPEKRLEPQDEEEDDNSISSIELQREQNMLLHPQIPNNEVEVLECTLPLQVGFNSLDLSTSHPSQLVKCKLFHISA